MNESPGPGPPGPAGRGRGSPSSPAPAPSGLSSPPPRAPRARPRWIPNLPGFPRDAAAGLPAAAKPRRSVVPRRCGRTPALWGACLVALPSCATTAVEGLLAFTAPWRKRCLLRHRLAVPTRHLPRGRDSPLAILLRPRWRSTPWRCARIRGHRQLLATAGFPLLPPMP